LEFFWECPSFFLAGSSEFFLQHGGGVAAQEKRG